MAERDAFEERYSAGVILEDPPSPARLAAPREALAAAVPSGSVALHGCVLSSAGATEDAYLVIEQGAVSAVADSEPQGVDAVIETAGIVMPGLVDLHGHPEYN